VAGLTISLTNPHKQLGVACSALVLAALTTPAVRHAWRERSPAAGYALLAITMWLFALGPMPHVAGTPFWYAAPYRLLFAYVPGFDELRVPARLWMIACAALAALAAIGVVKLQQRARWGLSLCVVLAATVVAEGWIRRLPVAETPVPIAVPAEARAVLEVPAGDAVREASAMFRSIQHGRPVLNGWSGYEPPDYRLLIQRLKAFDAEVLAESARLYGPLALVVDTQGDWHERYLAMAETLQAACAREGRYITCLIR
jgi:hypothetical protein